MSAGEVCPYCAGVQLVTTHVRHITVDGREIAPPEHSVRPCPVCSKPGDSNG